MAFVGMEGRYPSQTDCPKFEATARKFQYQCHKLALKLLSCFADGLGFPPTFFDEVLSTFLSPSSHAVQGQKSISFQKQKLAADHDLCFYQTARLVCQARRLSTFFKLECKQENALHQYAEQIAVLNEMKPHLKIALVVVYTVSSLTQAEHFIPHPLSSLAAP